MNFENYPKNPYKEEPIDMKLNNIENELLKRWLTEIWLTVSSSIEKGEPVDQKKFADGFGALLGTISLLQEEKAALEGDLIATLRRHKVIKEQKPIEQCRWMHW